MCHAPKNCLINVDWLIICVLLTCCTLYCRSTCGKSSISACKTRTPRTTKRSVAAVNVSVFSFLFFFLSFSLQAKWLWPAANLAPSPANLTLPLPLWLCWNSNEYFSLATNTIIAAGEHLVRTFRFFGFFKKKYWTAAKFGYREGKKMDVECGDINAKYSTWLSRRMAGRQNEEVSQVAKCEESEDWRRLEAVWEGQSVSGLVSWAWLNFPWITAR